MRQKDVTLSNAITDVTFGHFSVSNDAKAVTLLFHITHFSSIGYIGEVCLNFNYAVSVRRCFLFLMVLRLSCVI